MYEDSEYANSRLASTVVRHGKELVWVYRVDDDLRCEITSIKSGRESRVALKALNLKPLPLGYINHRGVASFILRKPMRRDWRQGYRSNNTRSISGLIFPVTKLEQPVNNLYPPLAECLRQLKGGSQSQAFSRCFAVGKGGSLLYKERVVGGVEGDIVVLDERYVYLTELLEESLHVD